MPEPSSSTTSPRPLVAVCAEAIDIDRRIDTTRELAASVVLVDRWYDLLQIVSGSPAKSQDELRAKARVARHLIEANHGEDTAWGDVIAPVVESLLDDVLGGR